jgi:ABC-type glycerol-3-phosphate transport system permease component
VAIVVCVATSAGYAFARYHFRGRDILFYIFIGAMMIPGQAILIPMFQFLKGIGLLNTLTGLSLSYLGGATAFSIFLMRAFFLSLPKDLGDAARIDGASEFGVFWRVYLPLARPGIATVVIIQSLGVWNEFMFSTTFISTPALKTIQPAMFQAVGRYATDYTALSSGLILALIPIVTVYLILQRQFISGLTAGALKA